MSLKINTNIAALNAHRNMLKPDNGLSKSLERLSSGLRINKAADDASGMAIADSLKAQALGLGQAIANANDGISVVQVADGALEESINIVNTIRTKALQAASDGQSADTRAAIQADIDRLLSSMDSIAKTTAFNGKNLLDGSFVNAKFHIGAYAAETVSFSIGSARIDAIGGISQVSNTATSFDNDLVSGTDNITQSSQGFTLNQNELTINGTDITTELNTNHGTRLLDAASVADAISEATGLVAVAKTEVTGSAVTAATIAGDTTDYLKINGVDIGAVTTVAGDTNSALKNAINAVASQSGVTATVENGALELVAADGRNISIEVGGTASAAGLTDSTTSATAADNASAAALLSTATTVVTLAEGQLIINGVDLVGSYGNGTAGSAADALVNAIKGIDGMSGSSIADGAAGGQLTLVVNNGDDLNISGTNAASVFAFAAADIGIANDSNHGQVSIVNEDKIAVAGNDPATLGFTAGTYSPSETGGINDVTVTSRNGAEMAIVIADSALKALDAVRSDIGSVQNQLESTVRNISITQVNITSAESGIRDVDFAAESANFAKFQVLSQSGSFAMAQANATLQNVLRLLQ